MVEEGKKDKCVRAGHTVGVYCHLPNICSNGNIQLCGHPGQVPHGHDNGFCIIPRATHNDETRPPQAFLRHAVAMSLYKSALYSTFEICV